MDNISDSGSPGGAPHTWTGQWIAAPWAGLKGDENDQRRGWWNHPVHRAVRAAATVEVLRDYLASGDWSEDGEALMAARAATFRAGEGGADYAAAVAEIMEEKSQMPLDLWTEGWRAGKWISQVIAARTPEYERLWQAIVEHQPWLLVHVGREACGQNTWKHPISGLLKNDKMDQALRLLDLIPASDWMDTQGNYYDTRRWWRTQRQWFNDDPSWLKALIQRNPSFLEIDRATGMGPLEQAAKDRLPNIVAALREMGVQPDPSQSFGLGLSHWVAFSVSEDKWDMTRREALPKTIEEIRDDISGMTRFLFQLRDMGVAIDDRVEPVITTGLRRARNMPKPKQDIRTYLTKRNFQPSTRILVDNALMELSTATVPVERKSKTLRL